MSTGLSSFGKKSGHTVNDIAFFVTHQPVPWTAHAWGDAVGVPESKFYESFEKYGNLANTSVAVNLLEAVENGLVKPGDKVMLASSGAGENHIALFHRIPPDLIKKVLRQKLWVTLKNSAKKKKKSMRNLNLRCCLM